MEPEEESASASQNQNLHDLQNYLVTFKNEIESSDDVLPQMDVDGNDVSDLYSGSGNHISDTGDGEGSGQFSSGFYSEQGMLGTSLSDDPSQHQIENLVSSDRPGCEMTSAKDGMSDVGLDSVQSQIDSFENAALNPTSGLQSGTSHQDIIMTSLGDGLDPTGGKMIQIVSLGGDEAQYLSLADGQQMQILNSEDLGLTSESLEQIDNSVDSSSSTATAFNGQTQQMALVSLSGNASDMPSGSIDIMAPDGKFGSAGLMTGSVGNGSGLFNPGLASLVALPGPMEGSQPQLFALHRPGISPESLQMSNLLGADGGIGNDLACQTITIVPSDMSNNGEMNYVLILSQPDGSKDGMASVAQICDLKQETTEITDTIIDENGETKNVLRLVPKKLVNDLGSQQLVCAYCNYTTPKRYLLTRHMKSHSEERPFKCDACSRGFKTAASLLNHVNTHTGTRPHKCKTCEAAFTTSGELVRHIRYRHTFEKPHSCPQCEYASVELSKLKRHMRSHTGERPYKCPSCPYASPDTYKLKRHMRIHTGEKPYECDICHARFTQSNSLKAHKLIHTGNKPIYQCSLCPTTCGRKTDLKIHFNKLHGVGSPLDCKKCGKEFSDRYSYKQHVRTHDADRCFKCDQCDFMAATEKNLELHMSLHGRKYECDECHLSFILKHLLDKHKIMFHSNTGGKNPMIEGKIKNDSNSGFVSALNQFDLSDNPSESEESSNLLSTPSTSDTLHKNLMQDIKEGKLGDVPQVVIVHPDGSQEEISSKLTGDKWSIEELFSTATNNGHTRLEDSDKETTDINKQKETESMTHSDDSSSIVPLSHSLLQTAEVETHDLLVSEESEPQDSCFTHTEASQLCEASTQAEIESDTDSSGELSHHQDILNVIHLSDAKHIQEEDGALLRMADTGTSDVKTSSSSSLLSSTVFAPPPGTDTSADDSSHTSLNSVIIPQQLSGTSNFTIKSNNAPQQYSLLKNIKFLSNSKCNEQLDTGESDALVKMRDNIGETINGVDSSSREISDLPPQLLTSMSPTTCSDSITTKEDNLPRQLGGQNRLDSLVDSSDTKGSCLSNSANTDEVAVNRPEEILHSDQKEFIASLATVSCGTTLVACQNITDQQVSPTSHGANVTNPQVFPTTLDTNIADQQVSPTTLGTNIADQRVPQITHFTNITNQQVSQTTLDTNITDQQVSQTTLDTNITDQQVSQTTLDTNITDQQVSSPTLGPNILDQQVSQKTHFTNITEHVSPTTLDTNITDNVFSITTLVEFNNKDNSKNELETFLPARQKGCVILNSNNCDNVNKDDSPSLTETEKSITVNKLSVGDKQSSDSVGHERVASCNVDGQLKASSTSVQKQTARIRNVSTLPRPEVKKGKLGKRHTDVDQSLVMTGKRMRKALVKISL